MLKHHIAALAVLFALGLSLPDAGLAGAQASATTRGKQSEASGGEGIKTYGSKNAPITMEVFSDYQCPSCRALYEETLKPLIADYVALGKVYLVHRDFPLPMHAHSWVAARYANAAARIGKFPQVEAALFDNQAAWTTDGDIAKFVVAAVGPEDMRKIDKLMPAGCKVNPPAPAAPGAAASLAIPFCPLDAGIQRDADLGKKVPVTATPTFQVMCKGKTTTTAGTVTYPVLKQYFDYLLSH
jgi:protein-disulfide isomerase